MTRPESRYTDWLDFTEKVCRPIVEIEDDTPEVAKAIERFREVSPYYIACALVMAANRVNQQGER